MKIILDENAGFCYGVKKAVNKVYDLIKENGPYKIYTYGPIIHNKQVIQDFEGRGVYSLATIEDCNHSEENSKIIIRSHGISEKEYNSISKENSTLIDCTCPYVSSIHKIVNKYHKEGYKIFIAGDKNHPEVEGINGWCDFSATIIDDQKTVDKLPIYDKICLVAQTTITKDSWDSILCAVNKKYKEVEVFNTICNATQRRQTSTDELSKSVDSMIVVGSFESSNTNKLFNISKNNCQFTFHIETAADLNYDMIKNKSVIGITAGASTPDWIIKEVIAKMEELQNNSEMNMMEEYEKSFKSLDVDDNVKGTVISVSDDEVIVNIGYKADGIIKKEDFTWNREANLKELIKPNDEIEVKILKINDGEGNVVLSKKEVDAEKNWYKIEYAFNEKSPVEGYVTDLVRGGGIVELFGIRAFMPASLFDLRYSDDLTTFLNKKVNVIVSDYDKEKRKIIVSRKDFMKLQNQGKEKALWESIEEGQKITGEVKRLTDFGAFVDIGGVDGLIHISELSWSRIKHPSEIVKTGQKVDVVVLSLDRDKKKISLGLKQTYPQPWDGVENRYNIGDVVDVKVLRFADFGAFVELEPGVDGLVHISQISDKRINKPSDILHANDIVKAKILEINLQDKKISLSIKEANEQFI